MTWVILFPGEPLNGGVSFFFPVKSTNRGVPTQNKTHLNPAVGLRGSSLLWGNNQRAGGQIPLTVLYQQGCLGFKPPLKQGADITDMVYLVVVILKISFKPFLIGVEH